MKADPEYRKKMQEWIKRDMANQADHPSSVDITVGLDEDDYKVKSWPTEDDSEFWKGLKDSAYKNCDSKETVDDEDPVEHDKNYNGTLDEYLRKLAENPPDIPDGMVGRGPVRSPLSYVVPSRFSARA